MNSQNRMNAGAEYVLYRIWATLQDRRGIHAESLLTCVGALAGYACQVCVRETAALPGADPSKYTLLPVETRNGTTYFDSDALKGPLTESPLSVWALVSRAVQKLRQPLPDIEGIFTHVTQTLGTRAFGIPRVPGGNRPRHSATVYVKQVWPQILPIAQRFCTKPMQLPVLFGIALQRAIEQTEAALSPTLGASIAMECAVAMSKVALPGIDANPAVTWPAVLATESTATPMLMPSPARDAGPESAIIRAIRAPKRRNAGGDEASAPGVGALVARIPPAARIVTIVSLAFIAVAGVMYKAERREAPEAAREVPRLANQKLPQALRVVEQSTQETQVSQEQPAPVAVAAPSAPAAQPAVERVNEDNPPPLDSNSDGSAEMLMGDSQS